MSSLQDTPQQALAGWLLKNGGEKAVKKMAEDIGMSERFVGLFMGTQIATGFRPVARVSISICLYTDGEVIFPSCPDWAVEKVRGLSHG